MDVWMLPVCLGIINLFPLHPVSVSVFQAESQVIWSDAEVVCQHANATLFKPDKESFDMQLFTNQAFDGNSWVAATYTFVSDPETSFRIIEPDARDRCIAFEAGHDCTGQYWHKACNETYSAICESYTEPVRQWILGRDITWIAASDLCHSRSLKLAPHITNARQFFNQGPCQPGFHWTGSAIEIAFQSNMLPSYSQGACGFLQNHILSFGNCSKMMRPLCITGTSSLQHDIMASTPLSGEFSSSSTSSYWITEISSTENAISLNETQMERDISSVSLHDETFYLSDAGVIIIGCVLGGTVFIFLLVFLVIMLKKRLAQGNPQTGLAIEMSPKTLRLNKTQNPWRFIDDSGKAVLENGSVNARSVSVTSNPEEVNGDHLEEISVPVNSINFRTDIQVDDTNSRQMKTKVITPHVYDSIHLEGDIYDHVEYEKKPGSGNVTVHVYDKANFHLSHERGIQGSVACDTTGECNTSLDEHDGEYSKADHILVGDHNTIHLIGSETDTTLHHV
ncbi:hypothetical protein ACJMK2_021472 [Sinanodonta woodiana]|uniref:C-type lectin domain-containing protein n=1 Tax=Sinanodonta woodiana TaxID=1069815 RepID=A0ABD3TG69_SINWO